MIGQGEHVNPPTPFIWTQADRLCRQCSSQPARKDDWLCHPCRHALERIWQTLPLTPKTVVKRHVIFTSYTA